MDASTDVAAFILAGGKSTRMGTDKAFVEYERRTLLATALEVARSVTPDVRIVGNRQKFSPYASVVQDIFCDCGPLAGIHAALRASVSELHLMLAVDMPFISRDFLNYLIGQARNMPHVSAVVPRSDGRLQPLCSIYRAAFADAAESALHAGQYKIGRLFEHVPTRVIEQEQFEAVGFSSALFRNFNTPAEVSGTEVSDSV
jgi:molybdopterin-guanine dinucleotide biosynthesis protein A